jgi:hypothetical protein
MLLLSFSFVKLSAQAFYGGITGGATITQYNGDNRGGYNKINPKAGIFITRDMPSDFNYQLELLFIQKGSQYSGEKNQAYYNLRLRYIEMPVSLQYNLTGIHIPGLINWDFNNLVTPEIGLSAAYLLQAREDDIGGGLAVPSDPFKPYDFSLHAGVNYHFNEHWAFLFRYSYSFIPVREHPGGQTWLLDRGQYNNVLHFSFSYRF